MTICLRHDCILTERDERVGVKGHGRAPARTQQHVDKTRCVGRANTHDEYVSFYKQDGTHTARFIADYIIFGEFLFHLVHFRCAHAKIQLHLILLMSYILMIIRCSLFLSLKSHENYASACKHVI